MKVTEQPISFEEAFGRLKGQRFTSAHFIHDHVQFGFQDASLTAHSHPVLRLQGATLGWRSEDLRPELCNLIDQAVVETQVGDEQVLIRFEKGAELIVPFYDREKLVAQALEFQIRGDDNIFVI